jgi:tetratricopeptide (TPR) repeat protein
MSRRARPRVPSADVRALVGRQRQLSELALLIDGLGAGRGGLVLLSGEAGAGKTRLAEEAARLAAERGIAVAWATGWDTAAAPLSTWTDLLAGLGLPEPASDLRPSEVDPEAARSVLVRDLVSRLRAALAGRPALLVVDDLQWCDALSLHALSGLVGAIRSSTIGLIVTRRDDGTAAPHLDALARRGRHLIVPPLTDAELHQLARDVTGREWSPAALARLRDRTAGNVLFATGLLEDAEPTGVSSAVTMFRERLRGLPAEVRTVLEAASVIGRRFRLDLLAETVGSDTEAVLVTLGAAQHAGLVRDSGIGSSEFAHPLMAEACLSNVDLPRRIRLHRDVGEALERLRGRGLPLPSADLAHHFAAASSAGVAGKAATYAAASARERMTLLAYEDAARDFQLALDALDLCPADDALRTELLLELGDAHAAAGDLPSARRSYESAAELARRNGWAEPLARAALGVGSGPGGFEVPTLDRAQIALLEEAASQATGTQRAQVIARLSVALSLDADADRRARLSEEAIVAARGADDPVTLGYALASQCDVIAGPAHVDRRLAATAEILACAAAARDTRLELLGRRLRIVALLEAGDLNGVDEQITAYADRSDRLSQVVYSWFVPLWRAMRAVMEGRLEDANRLRREAIRLGEAGHSNNATMLTGSQEAMVRCELGEGAADFYESVALDWPNLMAMIRPGLAYSHACAGDLDRARDVFASVRLDECTVELLGSEWLPSLVMLAHVAAAVGDGAAIAHLRSSLLPFRRVHAIDGIGAYAMGSVERALGVLAAARGDVGGARHHFDAAVHEHRRLGARLLVAGTLRDAGRALSDDGLAAEATSHYVALGLAPPPPAERPHEPGVFRREGDVWVIRLDGATTRVRDSKGVRDLARLLGRPGEEVHVLDLVADGPTLHSGDAGDAIDATARRQYQARLRELEEELDEADRASDAAASERLQIERDALLSELSRSYGLGGRTRRRGDASERARSAVTQRIRDAIGRIEAADPTLGGHLRRSVRTGTFCAYEPERPVVWSM